MMFAASFLLFVAGVPLAFAAPYSQAEASQPHDVVYVDPIRSSSGSSTSTTAQSPVTGVFVEAATTKLSTTVNKQETTNVAAAEGSDDTVKAQFSASTTWDFAMVDAIPTDLHVSTDHIKADSDSPMSHTFETSNVAIEDGFLVLNVPGDQAGKSDLSSAEVVTTFDMMYGSVRTWAILTEEPGVCNGIFFYEGDDQETDIEWISDPSSQSNKFANNGTRALQYTNQALDGIREHASGVFGMAPDDATSVGSRVNLVRSVLVC